VYETENKETKGKMQYILEKDKGTSSWSSMSLWQRICWKATDEARVRYDDAKVTRDMT
jgi:hypothetical protein